MAQQTAVEWLMDKSLKHTYILNTEYVKDKRIIIELDEFINLFEQAKQMEKGQMAIQLPSDEEIEEASNISLLYPTDKSANFRIGAKWMKYKILNIE